VCNSFIEEINVFFMANNKSRRKFLYNLGLAGLGVPLLSAAGKFNPHEQSDKSMNKKDGKLGVALVGLGNYATGQLAPALQQTEHCYLAGIVTGTASKAAAWKEKYNIPEKNIYSYDNYDSIKNNPDIDIIYVVLPNSMHAEYSIRAAKAGKHVTCEKPMALTVEDCDKMIAACKQAGKMLSIGYRLHFDPYHLEVARIGQQKVYGEVKKISAAFSFIAKKGEWRLDKTRSGGGPLMDLGIYSLQAVCYTTGMEPIAVTAQTLPITDKEKFVDIEETITFQMEMPNGCTTECRASYSENMNYLRIEAEKGFIDLQPAFNYTGTKARTSAGILQYQPLSQQAKQMDAFALAIKNNQPTIVPGEMGRRDMKIIAAIYEAMRTGKKVEVTL
jgi:predicted dehydrogenase